MNKEYYNNCINRVIQFLIEEKETYCEEITEIATHLGDYESDNKNLDRLNLGAINDKRNNMGAIYELIADLEKLRKDSE